MNEGDAVTLTVKTDPVLRDLAKARAKEAGISLADFVARAIQQASAKATAERAMRDAAALASENE